MAESNHHSIDYATTIALDDLVFNTNNAKFLEAKSYSRTTRHLTLFEIVMSSLFFFTYTPYYFMLSILISSTGYYGAKKYNLYQINIYYFWNLFLFLAQIIFIALFYNNNLQFMLDHNTIYLNIFFVLILVTAKLYILVFLNKFRRILKNLTVLEINDLNNDLNNEH
jgi:hypothetical protein